MKKWQIIKQLEECGVVAVVRAENEERAINIIDSCILGGIKAIEVTFTVDDAPSIIKTLSHQYDDSILIGAGTVLDATTARIAIMSGAKYVVSPAFDAQTAEVCNLYQIPYLPGCMTVTEVTEAMKHGVDIIKLFPGNNYDPNFIKSIKGPIPHANIMPTGGVDLDNIEQWVKNGACAVGIGSALTKGTNEEIMNTAKQYVEKLNAARGVKL